MYNLYGVGIIILIIVITVITFWIRNSFLIISQERVEHNDIRNAGDWSFLIDFIFLLIHQNMDIDDIHCLNVLNIQFMNVIMWCSYYNNNNNNNNSNNNNQNFIVFWCIYILLKFMSISINMIVVDQFFKSCNVIIDELQI